MTAAAADGVEPTPDAATAVFGDRLPTAQGYAAHLATTGVEWGLIGPRELPRLWTRHVLNCAVLGELVPRGATVLDIGSGAGLPGLALAIARPDARVTLVEPLERRVSWLDSVRADLRLDVGIRRARAEDLRGQVTADVVTSRAVAPLRQLARWSLPLTAPGGTLLAIKGRTASEELAASTGALRALGATAWDVVQCGTACLEVPTTVVRVRVGDSPPVASVPARRRSRPSHRKGTR